MSETKTTHKTTSREEWLKARIALLKEEKELTHRSYGPGDCHPKGSFQGQLAAHYLSLHVRT